MLREKIKKIFNNKALYMVLSIIAAILLWAYVTNIQNQDMEITIPGIMVTFSGQEKMLSDRNLIVDPHSNYSVALKLMGKRDVVSRLSNSNVTVSIDLSDISSEGTYNRLFTVNLPSTINTKDIYVLSRIPEYVSVRIIQYETTSIEVTGTFKGTFKQGCEAKTMEFSPAKISVGGPKSVVSQIAYAWVYLDDTDVGRTLNKTVSYIFVDDDGNKIPTDDLKVDSKFVEVTLPVIMSKDVQLSVKFNPGGGATKANVDYTISPSSIKLSGDPEILDGINEIVLHSYNLEEILDNKTETFNIPIQSELSNLSGQGKAVVKLSLKGLSTKTIQITDVQFNNLYSGRKATPENPIDVTIRGAENVINNITADDISVAVDLSSVGQSLGKYLLSAKVTVKNRTDVAPIGTYNVSVLIEDSAQPETQTQPPTQTQTQTQT